MVAEIAARQAAVVSAEQLRAAGLERGAIHHRVRRGRLHRVHRGVYVVGVRRITPRGRLWAAVLACGGVEAAAVSHVAAASAWELLPAPAEIDVVSLGDSRSVPGLRVHRCRTLEPASEFEERLLALVERCGLPAPKVNHRLLGYTVDFFWPEARLIVETDGFHSHSGRAAFEDDRERDAELYAAGYVVLRFTWRQLIERPDWVAAMLTAAYRPGVEQIRSGF